MDVALEQMDTNEDASGGEDSDAHMSESLSPDPEPGSGVVIGPVTFSAALLRAIEKFCPLSLLFGKALPSRGDSVTI